MNEASAPSPLSLQESQTSFARKIIHITLSIIEIYSAEAGTLWVIDFNDDETSASFEDTVKKAKIPPAIDRIEEKVLLLSRSKILHINTQNETPISLAIAKNQTNPSLSKTNPLCTELSSSKQRQLPQGL